MKIMFYSTKPYDKLWFEPMAKDYGFEIHFVEMKCDAETVLLADGYDAICIFVNDYVNAAMIDEENREIVSNESEGHIAALRRF